jgi:hypothetical protein
MIVGFGLFLHTKKKFSYEKSIFDTAISHFAGQLWRKKGAEREGSDESENAGGIT